MKEWKIEQLYTLDETIAAAIFDGVQYPWEVLGKIKDFIVELGNSLPEDKLKKGREYLGGKIGPYFSQRIYRRAGYHR